MSLVSMYDLIRHASEPGIRDQVVDIVFDNAGFRLGQVVGDGVLISLTMQGGDNTLSASLSGKLCLELRTVPTGLWAVLFDIMDIGFAPITSPSDLTRLNPTMDSEVMTFDDNDENSITNKWICTQVTESGYYFPIFRTWVFEHIDIVCIVQASFYLLSVVFAVWRIIGTIKYGEFNQYAAIFCAILIIAGSGVRATHLLMIALRQLQQLYPEVRLYIYQSISLPSRNINDTYHLLHQDFLLWHALVSPGLFLFATAFGAYLYTTIRPPSARMGGGFVSRLNPKRDVMPVLGTFVVTIVPAVGAAIALGLLYLKLDQLFPDAWSVETRVNVVTLDRTTLMVLSNLQFVGLTNAIFFFIYITFILFLFFRHCLLDQYLACCLLWRGYSNSILLEEQK